MADISIVVKHKLSIEEFDVTIDDSRRISELIQQLQTELVLPDATEGQPLTYKLVDSKSGLMLANNRSFAEEKVQTGAFLYFWGEPTAAAGGDNIGSIRLQRLYREHQLIRQRYRHSENVVVESGGDPPETYTVTFRVNSPVKMQGGQLLFGNEHTAQIRLLVDYPAEPPVCKMLTPAFHPNISPPEICIGDSFPLLIHVADVIEKIGNMLQYRDYDLRVPYQNDATEWARQQGQLGPFDTVPFGEIH